MHRRRDFTVNALFFDPVHEEIWDYLNGYEDIKARRLRIIGDPVRRYREDPVRMLRVVRLAAKLDMQLDPDTAAPIAISRRCCAMCRHRGCSTKC